MTGRRSTPFLGRWIIIVCDVLIGLSATAAAAQTLTDGVTSHRPSYIALGATATTLGLAYWLLHVRRMRRVPNRRRHAALRRQLARLLREYRDGEPVYTTDDENKPMIMAYRRALLQGFGVIRRADVEMPTATHPGYMIGTVYSLNMHERTVRRFVTGCSIGVTDTGEIVRLELRRTSTWREVRAILAMERATIAGLADVDELAELVDLVRAMAPRR